MTSALRATVLSVPFKQFSMVPNTNVNMFGAGTSVSGSQMSNGTVGGGVSRMVGGFGGKQQ